MIVQCQECETRYQLEAGKVPPQRIRVRCPKCRYVFSMDGSASPEMVPETVGAGAPSAGEFGEISLSAPAKPLPASDSTSTEFEIERKTPTPDAGDPTPELGAIDLEPSGSHPAAAQSSPEPAVEPTPAPEPAAPAASEAPTTRRSRREGKDDPSRRLARALVSDILVYNREQRDQSLKAGKLVQVLGPEIKKSWELYKEKVTPEVANSTNHFREALNEILAEGQKIF